MVKMTIDFTRTPFHMPGHKRNAALFSDSPPLPYEIDVTEIDGADDLHDMHGHLAAVAELAARLYGAERAFPMVNGSTGGILAAVRAAATLATADVQSERRKIIMTRESHRSVYNAAELCDLEPIYLESTAPQAVADALAAHPDAACVLITSPTYLGKVADIAAIATAIRNTEGETSNVDESRPTTRSLVGHESTIVGTPRVPLIIDGAHGAHFGFHDAFPPNATRLGADIEIVSLHKTLPALTQASLLLCRNDFASEIERQLRVFETSSPSYVLLASIERCLRLLDARGDELFAQYTERLQRFYARTALKPADDIGKIVIPATSGAELMDALRAYGIELEMCGADYALAMTSIADTDAAFTQLADALDACKHLRGNDVRPNTYRAPQRVCTPSAARRRGSELLPYAAAQGRVAREYVWAYPPGVPLVVPGEVVDAHVIAAIDALCASGIAPRSDCGALPKISVVG